MRARVYADASYHAETRTCFWVAVVEYEDGPRHQLKGREDNVSTTRAAEAAAVRGGVRSALSRAGVTSIEAFTDHLGLARSMTGAAAGVPAGVTFTLTWANKRDRESREGGFVDRCDRVAYALYSRAKRALEHPRKRRKKRRPIDDRSQLWTPVGKGLRCPACTAGDGRPCRHPAICVGPALAEEPAA